jgi:sugar/nucleoside kinase (ribokinase family)
MISALCYGSLNPDLVHRLGEFPSPGDDVRSVSWRVAYGGGAANPAVALATWGVTTAVLGNTLGDDLLGRWLLDDLALRGVDVSLVDISATAITPLCVVLVGPDGERTIVSSGYDNTTWQEVTADAWIGRSVAVVDSYSGRSGAAVIRRAADSRIPTVGIDVTGRTAAPLTVCVWSGHEHKLPDALALSRSGPDVILTQGGEAAVWCRTGDELLSIRPPDVEPVDPTGAGDTLSAMIALGVGSEWSPDQTLRMAVAAASLTVGFERGDPIPDLGSITEAAQALL